MLDLLRQRRSVRMFTDQPIEAEKTALLEEALLRAPTSRNLQPCQFIFVDDAPTLNRLTTAKEQGAGFFTTAPLAIIIAADPRVSDVWIEDSAIAAIIVQLVAEELGLKSCWTQLRLRNYDEDMSSSDFVRELLGLPEEFEVAVMIAVGYPDENKTGHPQSELRSEKIHHNRYAVKRD